MGLGSSLPPAKLVRRDSALFVEVKCIFSTMPVAEIFSKSSWIETKANGGHWGDRTLNRTRFRLDRTCPVSGSSCARWRVRSHAIGRVRSRAGAYWKRLDAGTVTSGSSCGASGRWLTGASAVRLVCPVVAWSASGHTYLRA
jgi:hypothetical protein